MSSNSSPDGSAGWLVYVLGAALVLGGGFLIYRYWSAWRSHFYDFRCQSQVTDPSRVNAINRKDFKPPRGVKAKGDVVTIEFGDGAGTDYEVTYADKTCSPVGPAGQ